MNPLEQYFGKNIEVECIDGIVIIGHVSSVISALDSEREIPELDIQGENGYYYNIPQNEIKTIKTI